MKSVCIITLSDTRGSAGKPDKSGAYLQEVFAAKGYRVQDYSLLPDDRNALREKLLSVTDEKKIALVVTTGGTGLAPRDITPETTKEVIEKEVPGLMEWLRHRSMSHTKRAVLSRGVAGIRGRSLIINLPGSPRAVREYMDELWEILPHALETISGNSVECARKDD